jgi:long-chain acyl-CoA synthetase
MKSLLDLLSEMERLGGREAVLYDDGYRTDRWTYRDLLARIGGSADELRARGLAPGDRVLLWGENRPEWVAVFWAAVTLRVAVVPIDFRSSAALVARIQKEVGAKLLVHGSSVEPSGLDLPRLELESISERRSESRLERDADPDAVVQVIYTSGTTGEPKGVVHRHRHLVATLAPIRKEIEKYSLLARPFQPVRFLDLLPLSHVFGQFTGLYIPLSMGGAVAFLKEVHPGAILQTIRRERISVLISVPRFLESLRREIERRFDLTARPPLAAKGLSGGLRRFWRHRDVHAAFGFKFWAILSGGARLAPEEEDFWYRLGFAIVQGYGLTETSSLVTTNHPLHPTRGSLGKAVGGQQIRLAEDGEILVRGDNVSLELFGHEGREDGWLATGDLGELGADGTLFYKGRKKDVIIGSEGLNVYPTDVETVLERNAAVKEAVVLGRPTERGEIVHAVLLLRDRNAGPGAIVEAANRELEHHQRIREWTVWPDEDFPRTASTFKVRRHKVQEAIANRRPEEPAASGGATAARILLARQLGRRPEEIRAGQRLSEDLGLGSLDRIELLASLEEKYTVDLSESTMASVTTVEELEDWIAKGSKAPERDAHPVSPLAGVVRYARIPPLRIGRAFVRAAVMLPLFRHFVPLEVEGDLDGVRPPVIFAPNHTSNLDTIALVSALPANWRSRLAPAVSQDYFLPFLEKTGSARQRISLGLQFWLAVLALNVFPLPQATRGVREALQFAGGLVDDGYSILIFPEGRRSPDGEMHEFRPGVGLMAVRLGIPVVPIHIRGLFEVLSVHDNWPRPGPARLRFGRPLSFRERDDIREATERIEREVKRLAE